MNLLAEFVCSRVRAEILRLLFGATAAALHIREIERQSGLAYATIRQDLKKLVAMDLVREQKAGNRTYYRANREHPLFSDLESLVAKTVGIVEILRQALGTDGIALAFLFGSVARGEEKGRSDVDLVVLGSIGLREVSRRLSGVTARVHREVNPHVMAPAEFHRRLLAKDHFVSALMQVEKVFIKGNADELAAMGG